MNRTHYVTVGQDCTTSDLIYVRDVPTTGRESKPVTSREEIIEAARTFGASRIMLCFGWMPARAMEMDRFDPAMANRLWNYKPRPAAPRREFTQKELDDVADLIGN